MKSILLSGVVASLLLFSGCGDKSPAVDEKPQVAQEVKAVEAVKTESVASENAGVDSMSNEARMSKLEGKFASIYFDFDRFEIKTSMQNAVSNNASLAKGEASAFNVKLAGNCDEWGSDEYNFALGLKRANTVKKSLVAEGLNASRISLISYGESNPVCSDKTQACWSENRRVDITLLP